MKSFIRKFYSKVSGKNDLSIQLKNIATKSSAEYIYKNMLKAKPLKTDLEVLNFASKLVKEDSLNLEFGVYSGRSINFLSNKFRKIYGFDSFEGLPEAWHTNIDKGAFALEKLPEVNSNVDLIKGWFEDTLPNFEPFKKKNALISFLHVDCDLYNSTKTIFKYCGKYLRPDSIIVFNEYFNYPGWEEGEFKAFKEFTKEQSINYEYLCYNINHEQVAIKILE